MGGLGNRQALRAGTEMRTVHLVILIVITLPPLVGCNIRPSWGPPGPILYQRNQAALHDPFPDNRAGPAILGGRPLGYMHPAAEPTRLQSNSPLNR